MYPRREFPDVTKTFAELDLTPSATVLVLSVNFHPFYFLLFFLDEKYFEELCLEVFFSILRVLHICNSYLEFHYNIDDCSTF